MIRAVKEEGHYTLKRVKRLPKRGNENLLYAFIGPSIEEVYRALPNGEYETITIGGSGGGGGQTYLQEGDKITITGTGTLVDPFIINGATYTLSALVDKSFDLLENGTPVSTIDLSAFPEFTDLFAGNAVIEGGVVYDSITDTYYVWANKYIIDGVYYNTPVDGYVTLPDGDPTNPRIDIFYVQHDGVSPSVGSVQGTPAASPQSPDLTIQQAEAGFKIVAATETTPTEIQDFLIYDENAGDPAEWNLTTALAGADPASSTIASFNGAVNYEIPVNGEFIFTKGSGSISGTGSNTKLVFAFQTDSTWANNTRLRLRLGNSTDNSNNLVINRNNGSGYNFIHTSTGVWQIVSVNFSDFNNLPSFIDRVRFQFVNNPGNLYVDRVFIQDGLNSTPVSAGLQDLQSVLEEGPNAVSADGNSQVQFTIQDDGQGFNNLYTENLLGDWGNLYNDSGSSYTGSQSGNQYAEISTYSGEIFIEQGDSTGSFYSDLYFRPPTISSEIYVPAPATGGQKNLTISVNGVEADSTGNVTLPGSTQENIAKFISVTNADLSPGPTLEDRIVAYINSQGLTKLDTDAEIWIEYTGLTPFNVSTITDYGCAAGSGPVLDRTFYHDGEGAQPTFGDTIYEDEDGNTPHVSPDGTTHVYLGDVNGGGFANASNWLYTDGSGVMLTISCK